MIELVRETYRYRELIWALALKELKIRYKRSVLGFLWALLNPALLMLVLTLVFSTVMRFPIPHYAIFLLSVLLPWTFFSQSLSYAVESIVGNGDLIKKVRVAKLVFPMAAIVSNLINLGLSLIPLALLVLLMRHPFYWTWLYLPVPLLALTIFTMGMTFFFAVANVYYRDVAHILQIVLSAWFYVTPIIYSLDFIPPKHQWIFKLNPIIYVINGFRLVGVLRHVAEGAIDHRFVRLCVHQLVHRICHLSQVPGRSLSSTSEPGMSSSSIPIRLENITQRFRVIQERPDTLRELFSKFFRHESHYHDFDAVKNVSFEVPHGQMLGLIGRNGSGKSTLLKIVAGVYRPTAGKVEVRGSLAPLIELGAGFHHDLTGRENILLNGLLMGYSKREMQEREAADHRVRRNRRLHRLAGQAIFLRHVHAAGVFRGYRDRSRHPADRRDPRGRRCAFPAEVLRAYAELPPGRQDDRVCQPFHGPGCAASAIGRFSSTTARSWPMAAGRGDRGVREFDGPGSRRAIASTAPESRKRPEMACSRGEITAS